MRMLFRFPALAALPLVLLAAAGSASAQLEHVTMQLAIAPGGHDSVLFLPLMKGWYKEAGLDVEIRDGRGSVSTLQQVAAGQIDVAFTVIGPMPLLVEKGADLKVIAQWTRKTDLGVVVDADSPVKTAKDLKGLSLDIFAGSPWVPFVDAFTRNAGLQPGDIKTVYVDASALFATYSAGRVDGIWGIPPYTLPIVNPHRPSRGIDAYDYGIVSTGNGFTVRGETIAKDGPMLASLVKVVQRAWAYALAGHEDEVALAVEEGRPNAKIDRSVIAEQVRRYARYVDTPSTAGKPLGWQSETDWAAAIAALEQASMLKPGHRPRDFYTNQFISGGG